jgi:hypothetical protein
VREHAEFALLLQDIVGNPFRPVALAPEWRTPQPLPLLSRCTTAETSPSCPFWPTLCKTLGARMKAS